MIKKYIILFCLFVTGETHSFETISETIEIPSEGVVSYVSGKVEIDGSGNSEGIDPIQVETGTIIKAGIVYIKNGSELIVNFRNDQTLTFHPAEFSRIITLVIKE